jgi:hypothetical protein
MSTGVLTFDEKICTPLATDGVLRTGARDVNLAVEGGNRAGHNWIVEQARLI